MVASPEPKKIVELEAIEQLLKQNHIVIACGGGGIPVVRKNNSFQGVEAVIDKDFSSQVLANALHAKEMVMLTNETHAYRGYFHPPTIPLSSLNVAKARKWVRKKEFGEGSMKPKIEAGIRFIQKGGKTAYIGKTNQLMQVLNHETGTRIRG